MKLIESLIPDCFEMRFTPRPDERGSFVKTMQSSVFAGLGLEFSFPESFYSVSHKNVLRGMHFQLAPADGAKLVYCLTGAILDVAFDLRRGSPTFGQAASFTLRPELANGVYIPSGVAHGFYVLEGPATVVYQVSAEYNPLLDAGVRWDSLGFTWPGDDPIISSRDRNFPEFAHFPTPFRFGA
ncbi:dTDP-4-dehydrorhamnose 3,5-epimerase family protein [Terriglobus roseus]|uniref:dTDP-4-dehydrorhamnose 3,5-epimerase n=1 Tax=Terriglobus roseus TaxID=392734 RepID=A0A1H4ITW7_9BACT|nr:dTDP-4-dehydrorhamnose 3,5-epimerase family protein [Terriglobus roseus]SEB37076.1 dTDP-4-dehydrorhamnose 3,5-epimerase [Terriglobus roseus]